MTAIRMLLASLPLLALACAPVKQRQMEYLADPLLIPGSDAAEAELDAHVSGNREGAPPPGGAGGGGCGC